MSGDTVDPGGAPENLEPAGPSAETALRRSSRRFELLAETGNRLLRTGEPHEIIESLFERLADHLGLEVYLQFAAEPENRRLRLVSFRGIPAEAARAFEYVDFGTSLCGAVMLERRPRVVEQVQSQTDPVTELARSLGLEAYACYPVLCGERIYGTLSFGSRRRRHFEEDEIELMQSVSNQVALAAERANLVRQLEANNAQLRAANRTLQTVMETMPVGVVTVEAATGLPVFWNREAERMFGRSLALAVAERGTGSAASGGGLNLPSDLPLGRLLAGEALENLEVTLPGEGGRERMILCSAAPLHDQFDRVTSAVAVFRDITGMRRAEEALRESELRYRTLSEAVPVIVFINNAAAECEYCNPRWYEYTGMTADETLGRGWQRALHPDDALPGIQAWTRALEQGQTFEREVRIRNKDGVYRRFLVRAHPMFDNQGKTERWFGTYMDIEDHKAAEEAARRAQKFESLGILAGGIAHQFNNLLTGIMGGASYVSDILPPGHAALPILHEVVSAGERAAELTAKMLAYSGKGRFYVEPVSLMQVAAETCELLRQDLHRGIEIRPELQEIPAVKADVNQMQQLLTGLIMNGVEAIGSECGWVRVAMGVELLEEPVATAQGDEISPGRYVYLEVEDNGCGMDETTQSRIFDPFFSTKFAGRGLGLPAAMGIVRGHKGTIQVWSRPGVGSRFRVLLPAVKDAAAPARAVVLVVDDEKIVRETSRAILERAGYEVMLAGNGRVALELLERMNSRVSLIVLDMAMPLMSGEETARQLRKIAPEIPVLVASGYDEAEAARRFAGEPVAGFVQKPFTSRGLIEKVRQVLREP